MDDLIVQGGIIAGQQQDIAIQQGRIRAIAPGLHTATREQLDVTGKLVLPGFVESHIHPDKAFVADRAPGLQAGGPSPQILLAELKKAFTVDDVYQRARRALRYSVTTTTFPSPNWQLPRAALRSAALAAPEQHGPIHHTDHAHRHCPEGM